MEDAHNEETDIAPVLKDAVDDSARLLGSFVEEDEEHLKAAIEALAGLSWSRSVEEAIDIWIPAPRGRSPSSVVGSP